MAKPKLQHFAQGLTSPIRLEDDPSSPDFKPLSERSFLEQARWFSRRAKKTGQNPEQAITSVSSIGG